MAETGTREVSRHDFSIAYDGDLLAGSAGHSIDVQSLAPALLAFGKLIREADAEFNGKKLDSQSAGGLRLRSQMLQYKF